MGVAEEHACFADAEVLATTAALLARLCLVLYSSRTRPHLLAGQTGRPHRLYPGAQAASANPTIATHDRGRFRTPVDQGLAAAQAGQVSRVVETRAPFPLPNENSD